MESQPTADRERRALEDGDERNARALSLLRATVESTRDGILVVDQKGRIELHNRRFCELWGLPPEASFIDLDQTLLRAVLPRLEDPKGFLQRVSALYADPEAESHDEVRFKDGRILERFSRPQRLGREVVGRVWSFRDVTAQRWAMERALFLADSSRLLSSLDAEQAAEAVARRALPLLGDLCALDLIPDDAPPFRLFTVTLGDEAAELGDPSGEALAGSVHRFERDGRAFLSTPLRTRDATLGVLTFRALRGRTFGNDDAMLAGELAQRMTLSFDNARLFRQAGEALRIRDEFLSVAAHELRGPATALKLVLHGLAQPLPEAQRDRLLHVANRQVRHVARFVDELLDISRVRGEQMHLELEEVDLAAVVREVVARMGAEVANSGSALTVHAAKPVVGRWDRLRLEQLVGNLLGNALKFGRGKPVTLGAAVEDGRAVLRIADQGIGIPARKRESIFEAFERAASPRHFGGLGLGLFISKSIVSALGGTLSVESEDEQGATFTATLPGAEGG